jgi:flagellar FliL protein
VPTTTVLELDPLYESAAPPPAPARSRKWLIAAVAGGLALLGAAGGGAYYLWAGHGPAADPQGAASADASAQSYVDVPAMMVNLRSSDGRAHLLKLHFMLVATDAAKTEAVKAKLPLYLDALQPFLRELRPEDLAGSAAMFRLKEEMMARAADAFGTGMVRDVLIQDLVQQ